MTVEKRYQIIVLPECDRDLKRAHTRPSARLAALRAIRDVLATDPYNRSRRADISKLADVAPGDGQFRLRLGDYRLRYDIEGSVVNLHSFRPRRDAYRR